MKLRNINADTTALMREIIDTETNLACVNQENLSHFRNIRIFERFSNNTLQW